MSVLAQDDAGPAAPEPVGSGEEPAKDAAASPFGRRGTAVLILVALAALTIVSGLWFRGFRFHTWMGDDLYAWGFYNSHPSFHDLFLTATGGKYRPVTTAVQWALFQLFPSDFAAWTYVNVGLDLIVAGLVFFLVRRLARGDLVVAFLGALVYLTSRFSYYSVFQVMGIMEGISILLLVIILYLAVVSLQSDARWPGFALTGLYLVITLTHERYLALFPFLVLLVVFRRGVSWRLRSLLIGLLCIPPLLDVLLKRVVFATSLLMGTGGQSLGFDPVQIAKFMTKGAANMLWVNWGPDYLSGITISEMGPKALVLVGLIVAVIVVCAVSFVVRVVRLEDRRERRAELEYFVLWLVLVASLLLVASITIRQEYRWLYAPFLVCLVYFCYQFARLPWRRMVRYAVLVGLCIMLVGADHYYRQHEGSVFFFYGENIANSAYDATMGRYGAGMAGRTIYVEKSPDVEWILAKDLFLSPYLGLDHRQIVWVDSFDSVDPRSVDPGADVFLRMDWSQLRLVDVTRQVAGG